MHLDFGVTVPEMNAAPIFWRAVHVFKGSGTYASTVFQPTHGKSNSRWFQAVLYSMTKSLAAILELPLTLHRVLAPKPAAQSHKYKAVKSHLGDTAPPELSVIATVVLAIKLLYGLDQKSRSVSPHGRLSTPRFNSALLRRPRTEDDPATCFPEPEAFFAMLREQLEAARKGPDSLLSASSQRCVGTFLLRRGQSVRDGC